MRGDAETGVGDFLLCWPFGHVRGLPWLWSELTGTIRTLLKLSGSAFRCFRQECDLHAVKGLLF